MNGVSPPTWRATRLVWSGEQALLEWSAPDGSATRASPLPVGGGLSFATGSERRCVGIRRAGRRMACPHGAPVEPSSRTAQCPTCRAWDRSDSIAADTRMDDPRPFAVYLAHHGTAGVKVGITAAERGAARLLEQGALASTVLSTGTLASARRVEHLLGSALGLPDRVTTVRKRAARARPGTAAERARDLLAVAERARHLAWPEAQSRCDALVADHADVYGLPADGLRPAAEVLPLAPGCVVTGTTVCRIGSDLYLDSAAGLVVLDTRLSAGWTLGLPRSGATFTAPLRALTRPEGEQDALF
ncbi:Protein of unknown function [Sinosporangium album]|uniref:DUF2797 domain-containing protein n=1 Tax=Sinosporangium album TaxID=504805 RepID=A0A1G7ZQM0_9ACTN|nr:DUF2797 domain-containing protein [Sinosporangium album]SDH11013.1 Protein of unknown function [Sinosporangium album]